MKTNPGSSSPICGFCKWGRWPKAGGGSAVNAEKGYTIPCKDRDRQRKLRILLTQYAAGEIPLENVTASAQGWVNHVRYANTVGLRKSILGKLKIPRREG